MTAGLLLLGLLAGELEAEARVTGETGGGSAPVVAGQAPRAGMSTSLQPALMLGLAGRVLRVHAEYRPRLYWRYPNPNPEDGSRPLVLHTAELGLEADLSRRTELEALGVVSVGEADYTTLPALLGPGQGALPARLDLLNVDAEANLNHRLSHRWRAGLGAEVTYRRPLDDDPVLPAGVDPDPLPGAPGQYPLFARQQSLTGRGDLGYQVTRPALASASLEVGRDTQDGGLELWSVQPRLGWTQRLDAHQILLLSAGVAYVRQSGGPVNEGERRTYVSPLAHVGHSGVIHRWGGIQLSSATGATIEHYVDPVLGTAGPRGVASTDWSLLVAPRWLFVAGALFGTSLRRDPLPGNPDESMMSATLGARHRTSDHLVLAGGVRWSDRAAHLGAASFEPRQRELWAFLSATLSTRAASDRAAP